MFTYFGNFFSFSFLNKLNFRLMFIRFFIQCHLRFVIYIFLMKEPNDFLNWMRKGIYILAFPSFFSSINHIFMPYYTVTVLFVLNLLHTCNSVTPSCLLSEKLYIFLFSKI